MLKELYVENYKSLKNVTVQFKDGLNIIIGKNGSGKSNLLEFINTFVSISPLIALDNKFRFPSNYSYAFLYQQEEKNVEMTFKVESELWAKSKAIRSKNNVSIFRKSENANEPFSTEYYSIYDEQSWSDLNKMIVSLSEIRKLHNNLIRFNIPNRIYWLDQPASYKINLLNRPYFAIERVFEELMITDFFAFRFERELYEHYFDTSNEVTLNDIRIFFYDNFEEYKSDLGIDKYLHLFSSVESIRISPNVNTYKIDDNILFDNLTLEFKLNDVWVPWSYLSDGTKRLFYLISEICTQEDGLILIEEPELGIHPDQLFKLMQFIKEQSETKQIIISTHSPIVLDCLKADELDRIIIARSEKGVSSFNHLTEQQIADAKEYMETVSDLSYYWMHSNLEEPTPEL